MPVPKQDCLLGRLHFNDNGSNCHKKLGTESLKMTNHQVLWHKVCMLINYGLPLKPTAYYHHKIVMAYVRTNISYVKTFCQSDYQYKELLMKVLTLENHPEFSLFASSSFASACNRRKDYYSY